MARLIPSFMDERTPPGERDVFNLLAAGPDDWTALHSLDLSPWNRGLRTEIDFVVIVPDTGIICLEVKSHENLSFDGNRWYPAEIKRSPFKQASDGRHTFYRRLAEIVPQFKHIPVVHACIFPRAPFDLPQVLSVQAWELMDSRSFRQFPSGPAFCLDLKGRMARSIAVDERLSPIACPLSPAQVEIIIGCCVPVQKRRAGRDEEIRHREEELDSILRAQQRPVLQLASLNPQLIVAGGAGTGKTLIAMEVARRAAEQGRRVALLSFNQLVGDWMERRVQESVPPPNLLVGPAIRVMAKMANLEIPEKPSRAFWESDLPHTLEERLTNPDFQSCAAFDYLVLDEAQDFLARPRLWACLAHFLAEGLSNGSFALFGDFENQVLADKPLMDQSLAALDVSTNLTRWRLDENCRNYRIVGDTAVHLSGLGESVYSGYLRTGGGIHNYAIFFYENERAQRDKLREWLGEIKAQGFKPSEITLLSLCSPENSVAFRLKQEGFQFLPYWQAGDRSGFTSIHAFKGMENKVVILTDVALGEPDFHRYLFYTGMTRATDVVRVLCGANSKETLLGWILKTNKS